MAHRIVDKIFSWRWRVERPKQPLITVIARNWQCSESALRVPGKSELVYFQLLAGQQSAGSFYRNPAVFRFSIFKPGSIPGSATNSLPLSPVISDTSRDPPIPAVTCHIALERQTGVTIRITVSSEQLRSPRRDRRGTCRERGAPRRLRQDFGGGRAGLLPMVDPTGDLTGIDEKKLRGATRGTQAGARYAHESGRGDGVGAQDREPRRKRQS